MPSCTRREALFATSILPFARAFAANGSRLAVEAYIFQQYAQRQNEPLADVLPQVIPMAHQAGFRNVEFNQSFLVPELQRKTFELARANEVQLPAIYNSGAVHDPALAPQAIQRSLEIAGMCRPYGCKALVFNVAYKGFDANKKLIEKTDAELDAQAEQLNQLGRQLRENGFELRVHNHAPEIVNGAREWRHMLRRTDPKDVAFCLDLNWVFTGGQDPLAILKEAGSRVREIHVRNEKDKVWLEDVEDGDIDYHAVAAYLRSSGLDPLIVVELAYATKTQVTRTLEKDLELSRIYTERVFGVS